MEDWMKVATDCYQNNSRYVLYMTKTLLENVLTLLTKERVESDNVEIKCNDGGLSINILVIASICKKWIKEILKQSSEDFSIILPVINPS